MDVFSKLKGNIKHHLSASSVAKSVQSAVCIINFYTDLFPVFLLLLVTHLIKLLTNLSCWKTDGWTVLFTTRKSWRMEGAFVFIPLLTVSQFFLPLFSSTCAAEPLCGGPLNNCPLPNPEMSFYLWTEDLDICEWLKISFEVEGI